MNTVKNIVRKYWKIVVAYAASIYGTTFTSILGICFLMDDIWVDGRLDCMAMMTCIPAMVWGVHTLKAYWISKALSRSRDLTVVETADKAA